MMFISNIVLLYYFSFGLESPCNDEISIRYILCICVVCFIMCFCDRYYMHYIELFSLFNGIY